jgi:hypothetical protein
MVSVEEAIEDRETLAQALFMTTEKDFSGRSRRWVPDKRTLAFNWGQA